MHASRSIFAAALIAIAILPFAVHSADSDESADFEKWAGMTPEERRAAWENLSEEEKQALRERRRAEWQAMTPEERQAKREEIRKRMESMTPEQREAMRKRMKRRRNRHGRQGDDKDQES